MIPRAERIRAALAAAFAPAEVTVSVVSPAFAGLTRIDRSRRAHAALEAEFGTGLHALSLRLQTPDEAAPRPE